MKKLIAFSHLTSVLLALMLTLAISTAGYAQERAVTFYANISEGGIFEKDWAGHVWIGLKKGRTERILGFYPAGLQNDANRIADISYTFQHISQSQLNQANVVVREYENNKYVLGYRDCRRFVQSIARALGLITPEIGKKSPAEWLADLVDAN